MTLLIPLGIIAMLSLTYHLLFGFGYTYSVYKGQGRWGNYYVYAEVYYWGKLIWDAKNNCEDYKCQEKMIKLYRATCKEEIRKHREWRISQKESKYKVR